MVAAVEVVAAEVAAGTAVAAMAVVGTVAVEAVTVGKVLAACRPPRTRFFAFPGCVSRAPCC